MFKSISKKASILLIVIWLSSLYSTAYADVSLTAAQILNHANSLLGSSYKKGYCLEWLATKFWQGIGAPYSSACCAYAHGLSHLASTDRGNIPIGANVYFKGSSTSHTGNLGYTHSCGHIGVYIGDDRVVSLVHYSSDPSDVAYVRNNTINEWIGWGYAYWGWGYPDGVTLLEDNPGSSFQFSSVTYPKVFRINTTNGWSLAGGLLQSNNKLVSIRSQIINSSGSALSDSGVKSISGYNYSIKSLDDYSGTNNGVRFSYITAAGDYIWRLTATDSAGRTLVMDMPFTAVDSGSTITATMSKEYDNTPQGTEMSTGYDQTIADGDYIIAVAADPLYYLDIDGIDVPASNNTNVSLYHADSLDAVSDPDVWTVTYNSSNKFYTIKQKGTDMCLDVSGDGMALGKNVQVYSMNSQGSNNKTCNWAISQNGTNGYRLQARCSGYSLSIAGGQIKSGANVEQNSGNGTDAQTWTFIPYGSSKPIDPIGSEMTIGYDRTISDGDYIIAVASDPLYYLDIDGIDVPAGNNTNVLLYHTDSLDNISDPDVWTITYNSSDKFYTIKQKGTDMCLDVSGDGMALGKNVQVYSMNSQAANNKTSNWAISKNNTNGYRLQARCSGFSLDIAGGRIANGANVQQYSGNETELQSWTFIPYGSVKPTEDVTGIILSQKYVEKDYLMGSTFRLTATLEPESAKDSTIFWSSSNPGIASVDNGLVTIRSAGYVQILAHTENDVWAACEVLIHPDKISILPKGLSIIAEEAWMGTSLKEVIIPEGVTSIESRAFANCPDLLIVRIPTSTIKIADDAFAGSDFVSVIRWPYDN